MPAGPLIPGIEEFDAPRRRLPRWIPWGIGLLGALVAYVVVLGFVAGAGPLRGLGLQTEPLQPIAFRPTANPLVMQVAVGMPPEGICRGDAVSARAVEDGALVIVDAQLTRRRNSNCGQAGVGATLAWLDISLDGPIGERSIIRRSDRLPLTQRTALG